MNVGVEVSVHAAGLASLDQLDSVHDVVGNRHLAEAELLLRYPGNSLLMLWVSVGVHENDRKARDNALLLDLLKDTPDLSLVHGALDDVPLAVEAIDGLEV